jgi:hypothetical protein
MAKPSQRQPINGLLPPSRLSCLYKNNRCAAPMCRAACTLPRISAQVGSPTCHSSALHVDVRVLPCQPAHDSPSIAGSPAANRRAKRTCHHRGVGSQAPHFPEPLARLDRRHELTRVRAVDAVERGTTPPRAAGDISRALKCRRNSSPPLRRPHNPSEVNRWFASLCDYAAMVRGWWRRRSRSGCGSVRPCGLAASRVDRPTRKPIVKSA